ncbi:hypothetical protein H4582DRAFT_2081112 [Lactarius indigo]|nr:hypothetical protein H4582DRAFT_2081112 [Lactarius indigo]
MTFAVPGHLFISAFGITTPTPNRGVCHHRDSDDFDYHLDGDVVRSSGIAPFTPGTTKRLKTSCDDIAHQYDVDPALLRELAGSQNLPEMILCLAAHLLKLEKLFIKNEFDVLLKSQEFRNGLSDRLLVSLLSPGIPAYVTDVTPRMLRVIKEQWRIFKVPKEIFEDPDYCSRLETTVSDLLTACWSGIKQKIEASFRDNGNTVHISILMRSALRDFVRFSGLKKPAGALCELHERNPTDNFTGVAGPRDDASDTPTGDNGHNADNYNRNNEDSEDNPDPMTPITRKQYTHQQFWNYIDDYLEYIRTELFADITDRSVRSSRIMQLFNEGLQTDMFNYKEGRKPPPSGELPAWQETLHLLRPSRGVGF